MISEIIPNLYIGTIYDAIHDQNLDNRSRWGLVIWVAEADEFDTQEVWDLLNVNRLVLHAPFMIYEKKVDEVTGYQNCHANIQVLQNIADIIELTITSGPVPILVHCAAGVERSPLAVIYYLVSKHRYSLEDAFRFVKQRRPIIEDRLNWMQ
jgi:protein-tyrosine phosphatase